ncbi:MAG: Txe/YoeB family addiction module toxin [Pseudomonadota bacterium]
MRSLKFTEKGWADYVYWQTEDPKTLRRLNELLKAVQREPFAGIGKPEALKGNLSGCWSRRIDQANRLLYQVVQDDVIVLSCRYHY